MNSRLAALAAAALLASCVGSAPDEVVNGVAVVTQRQPNADFATYRTFSVDPTIAVVDQSGSISTSYTVDATPLVPTIVNLMVQRGYTEVPWKPGDNAATNTADLQLKMEAYLGDVEVYYPGYCGWYPYYYCYPGWSYAGSYNFGSLLVTMGDRKAATGAPGTPDAKLPLIWRNLNYGILGAYYTPGVPANSSNVNWGRVAEAVTRAFNDSPYIKRTP
jgi:hypothetical protein